MDDPVEKPAQPIEVLLERELAKLSAELDKDLRAIETRLPSPKHCLSLEAQLPACTLLRFFPIPEPPQNGRWRRKPLPGT